MARQASQMMRESRLKKLREFQYHPEEDEEHEEDVEVNRVLPSQDAIVSQRQDAINVRTVSAFIF